MLPWKQLEMAGGSCGYTQVSPFLLLLELQEEMEILKPLPRVAPANTFPQSKAGSDFLEKHPEICQGVLVLQNTSPRRAASSPGTTAGTLRGLSTASKSWLGLLLALHKPGGFRRCNRSCPVGSRTAEGTRAREAVGCGVGWGGTGTAGLRAPQPLHEARSVSLLPRLGDGFGLTPCLHLCCSAAGSAGHSSPAWEKCELI